MEVLQHRVLEYRVVVTSSSREGWHAQPLSNQIDLHRTNLCKWSIGWIGDQVLIFRKDGQAGAIGSDEVLRHEVTYEVSVAIQDHIVPCLGKALDTELD